MREIKFRLFNKNTGLVEIRTLSELIGKTFRKGQFSFRGRFTDLKDKNGKEIYEGDILKGTYSNCDVDYSSGAGVVEMGYGSDSDGYSHGRWYGWKCGESSLLDIVTGGYFEPKNSINPLCEVIGNIYETPNLLDTM